MHTTLMLDFQKIQFEILFCQHFVKLFFHEKYVLTYLFIKNKMLVRILFVELKWVWILKVTATRIKDRDMYDIILYDCWWINSTFMDLFTVPVFFFMLLFCQKSMSEALLFFYSPKILLRFSSIWFKLKRFFSHKNDDELVHTWNRFSSLKSNNKVFRISTF